MTDETVDRLVEFVAGHCGPKPVALSWFGGEPLMGIRRIDRICRALTDRGIAFSSSMISNGYLFDTGIAARARDDWNPRKVQITLDGTEDVYNETKAYISPCESPYKRVLENIGLPVLPVMHQARALRARPRLHGHARARANQGRGAGDDGALRGLPS